MTGTPVAIGPFFGGLNTVNDPSTIEDNQCSTLQNFDIDIDGSLVTRPGFQTIVTPSAGAAPHFLTPYTFAGQTYVIASRRSTSAANTAAEYLSAIDVATGARTEIVSNSTANVKYTAALQYLDRLWYVAAASGTATANGGWWTPAAGNNIVANMPYGVAALIYKERMFIANPDGRIYFSKVAEFDQWEASGFFDVARGDGQKIQAMIAHLGQIVIFKDHSTYVLSYDAAPEQATLQQVSGVFGTETPESVTVHDNMIYTFHNNNLYAINNWRWQNVSAYVKIHDSATSLETPHTFRTGDASLSSVGRRLILRYRTEHWVYFPDLEAWSKWTPLRDYKSRWTWDVIVELPEPHASGYREYWAGSYVQHIDTIGDVGTTEYYKFIDGYDPTFETTSFTAIVASKMYDLQLPYNFKRLHWWGADILARSEINVRVFPETYNRQITWDEFNAMGKTWDQLALEGRTWDRLADVAIIIGDGYKFGYTIGVRSFVKFLKSLRFRKIVFEMSANTSGSIPLRIFSAMALVSNKQLGPRKAN